MTPIEILMMQQIHITKEIEKAIRQKATEEAGDLVEDADNKYANISHKNGDMYDQTPTEDEVEEVLEAEATGN